LAEVFFRDQVSDGQIAPEIANFYSHDHRKRAKFPENLQHSSMKFAEYPDFGRKIGIFS
jgi:hypothetical protein